VHVEIFRWEMNNYPTNEAESLDEINIK
jgi:hypothetical protein